MYKYYIYKVKKGYMVVYFMIAGLLLLSISLVVFKFELERKKILSYRRKALENLNETDYRRERLFSNLNQILNEKGIALDKATVIDYLKTYSSDFKLDFDDMSLQFLSDKEQILLAYNYNAYYKCVEYYDLDLSEGRLVFNLLSSNLVGRYDYGY